MPPTRQPTVDLATVTAKVVIIEDHRLIRDMLDLTCRNLMPKATVAVADTAAAGVALCAERQPDLVFLDLVLPDADGIDVLPRIIAAAPAARTIALSSFADEYTVHRALRAHVHGFVDKNEQPLHVLREAIEAVMSGSSYFSPTVQRLKQDLRADPASFEKLLSDREQHLLVLFGEGLTNKEVAEQLGMTANTVKVHRRNIHRKLGIHSAPELMNYALKKGFTRIRR